MRKFLFGLAIVLMTLSPAAAYQNGEWVLGKWQAGPYFYPGVVMSQKGAQVTVQYDDGDVETLHINLVKPYDWGIGTRVECNWRAGGVWYPGHISNMSGSVGLSINYDDGDFEHTQTSLCRSW